MKFQEGSVLKYPNLRIYQSLLGFIVDQNDIIMEVVNEWFQNGKFIKVGTTFRTVVAYEK